MKRAYEYKVKRNFRNVGKWELGLKLAVPFDRKHSHKCPAQQLECSCFS